MECDSWVGASIDSSGPVLGHGTRWVNRHLSIVRVQVFGYPSPARSITVPIHTDIARQYDVKISTLIDVRPLYTSSYLDAVYCRSLLVGRYLYTLIL